LREARHLGDDRRAARIAAMELRELRMKRRVRLEVGIRGRDLVDRLDERFRHEPPAVVAEERPVLVPESHHASSASVAVASMNALTAAAGSPPVTSASPTRTTSAPAAR